MTPWPSINFSPPSVDLVDHHRSPGARPCHVALVDLATNLQQTMEQLLGEFFDMADISSIKKPYLPSFDIQQLYIYTLMNK
jgi:hypothetical protein